MLEILYSEACFRLFE